MGIEAKTGVYPGMAGVVAHTCLRNSSVAVFARTWPVRNCARKDVERHRSRVRENGRIGGRGETEGGDFAEMPPEKLRKSSGADLSRLMRRLDEGRAVGKVPEAQRTP